MRIKLENWEKINPVRFAIVLLIFEKFCSISLHESAQLEKISFTHLISLSSSVSEYKFINPLFVYLKTSCSFIKLFFKLKLTKSRKKFTIVTLYIKNSMQIWFCFLWKSPQGGNRLNKSVSCSEDRFTALLSESNSLINKLQEQNEYPHRAVIL